MLNQEYLLCHKGCGTCLLALMSTVIQNDLPTVLSKIMKIKQSNYTITSTAGQSV